MSVYILIKQHHRDHYKSYQDETTILQAYNNKDDACSQAVQHFKQFFQDTLFYENYLEYTTWYNSLENLSNEEQYLCCKKELQYYKDKGGEFTTYPTYQDFTVIEKEVV